MEELVGDLVVIDLRSSFVCLGKLHAVGEQFLDVRNADLHDLRDTQTGRENYVAACRSTGIKRNRKRVFIARPEVVAISRLADVVER
jgi:hypothetical protein